MTLSLYRLPESVGGYVCCNLVGPDCDAPAFNLVVDDGVWHYQAACDNEQHMAEAIHLDLADRIEDGLPVELLP